VRRLAHLLLKRLRKLLLSPVDYRILLASIVEARECFHQQYVDGQLNLADRLHEDILERVGRLERGEYYYGHNRGTASHPEGDGEG